MDDWITRRLPVGNSLTLTQRNIYILPTGFGFFMVAITVLALIGSINYQANLGFLLTFMLAGSVFISTLVTHGTLRGLRLQLQDPSPVFAQTPITLPVQLSHPGANARHAIALQAHAATHTPQATTAPAMAMTNAEPDATTSVALALPAMPRGIHACPRVRVQTIYPLGAFRAWAIWRPASALVVYPAPEVDAPPLPRSAEHGDAGTISAHAESFELDGFKQYQRGDPLKTILWKKAATAMATGSTDWVRRDQSQLQGSDLWLDHAHTGLAHPEAVLSRLCAWVLAADRSQLAYGLRLPHKEIPIGRGSAHLHHCLRSLAEC